MVIIISVLFISVAILFFAYGAADGRSIELEKKLKEQEDLNKAVEDSYRVIVQELAEVHSKLKKTVSQKKSSEVKTGLIVEQMAPFLEGFPYEPEKANFLARPLDFVVFDDTGVHFVEVKSGLAQLSSKQRKIRDLIADNKVTFEVYRIKGE